MSPNSVPLLPRLWLRFTNLFRHRKKAYLVKVPEVITSGDTTTIRDGHVICVSPGTNFVEQTFSGEIFFGGYSIDELRKLAK